MAVASYDVVVVGASLGGVAAAIRAAALGANVGILEAGTWTGGQFTSQGVCKPDENQYVETVGSTASYRDFRHRCRAYYRSTYRLSGIGAAMPLFNAGGPWDANQPQFAVEPARADAVLKAMLAESPRIALHLSTRVTAAAVNGDRIQSLTAIGADGAATTYAGSFFLDATDLGDLLPLVLGPSEWVIGAEAHADTGEADAAGAAHAGWVQPITFCIALEHRPSGNYTIAKPAEYDALKAEQRYCLVDGGISTMFAGDAWRTTMWNYRRYIDARNFDDAAFPYDLSMINTASNDYQKASIPSADPNADAATIARAREAALGYLYWLQTECPRDDGSGNGYPELRPNPDAFGTADGVAPVPYIRESRRIVALKRIVESEVAKDGNSGPRAPLVTDSCGIGTYAYMDGHALKGAVPPMPGFWIDIWPVQIPASALVPRRLTNLLAACKNIGTTHLTNGLYRLHPLEWNVGEAAGALAAFAHSGGLLPRDVVTQSHLLRGYQRVLVAAGVPLFWWTDVPYGDPAFAATQLAGAIGLMTGDGNSEMKFYPDTALTADARAALVATAGAAIPTEVATRGAAAEWLDTQGLV
ncbi:MAG TPA: FAD-dependent oxidoreductase [Candidatus Lustribacter sp.]